MQQYDANKYLSKIKHWYLPIIFAILHKLVNKYIQIKSNTITCSSQIDCYT